MIETSSISRAGPARPPRRLVRQRLTKPRISTTALCAYEQFIHRTGPELIEELRPLAEAATEKYLKQEAKARELLAPAEEEYRRVHGLVSSLLGYFKPFRRPALNGLEETGYDGYARAALDLPPIHQYGTPPVPTREQLRGYFGSTETVAA